MDDWREKIRSAWLKCKGDTLGKLEYLSEENENVKAFYDVIWEASMSAFDVPREVQVVIDRDGKCFITYGTPSFVDFQGQVPAGMKMPVWCWIHTHPFGKAYFSGTDWTTINTWKLLMEHAVVLGGDERMYWYKTKPDTKFVRYESKIDDMDALYTSATDVIDENQRMLTEWDGSFI